MSGAAANPAAVAVSWLGVPEMGLRGDRDWGAAMDVSISELQADDYDELLTLWQASDGIGLDDDVDSRAGITAFLARNPGTSHVARDGRRLVGAVLCGHDGRRGYLHHLAVAADGRQRGVGRALVQACLAKLRTAGIRKCNIFLFADNELGEMFWRRTGWHERADLKVFQQWCDGDVTQSAPR